MHPEWRLQPGKHGRPFAGRNGTRHMAVTGDVIAEHDGDIRIERIGPIDDRRNAIQRHPWIAGMEIGDDGDLERKIRRPLRRRDVIARDAKPQHRFDAEPVGCGRNTECAQSGDEMKEVTA